MQSNQIYYLEQQNNLYTSYLITLLFYGYYHGPCGNELLFYYFDSFSTLVKSLLIFLTEGKSHINRLNNQASLIYLGHIILAIGGTSV